jgi:hypothetical protein
MSAVQDNQNTKKAWMMAALASTASSEQPGNACHRDQIAK